MGWQYSSIYDAVAPTRTMRVLLVSHYFDDHRGGVEMVAGHQERSLSGAGVRVTWAATGTPPSGVANAVELPAWNITEQILGVPNPLLGPKAVARLWRAIGDADAVMAHDGLYLTTAAALVLAKLRRKPIVLVQHIGAISYRSQLLRGLMALANATLARWALRTADQVVFISGFVREHFRQAKYRRRPLLIFNAVDAELFRAARPGQKVKLRKAFNLPDSQPVALFVGRFVEKKGLPILQDAARQAPGITWVLAGWGPIDPSAWCLSNVRVLSGLSRRQIADLYRAADVFVLPSHGEGFPLVVQEALATGLPVVCGEELRGADPMASDLLRTVVTEGRDAAAVAGDVVAAVRSALADEVNSLAGRRADLARARYSEAATVAAYRAILDQLAAERAYAGV